MRKMVKDVLQGENRLLYTYGVTNSGKTYTVQGEILLFFLYTHVAHRLWKQCFQPSKSDTATLQAVDERQASCPGP